MKKIIAFAGSNSSTSINRALVQYAGQFVQEATVEQLNLSDYNAPLYSKDLELNAGIPPMIKDLHEKLRTADGFLVASPEHNGLIPAFFKNMIDWLSRVDQKIFGGKPVALLSTSPGKNGGASNLRILAEKMPRWGAELTGSYSLPSFHQNFNLSENRIANKEEKDRLQLLMAAFNAAIKVPLEQES